MMAASSILQPLGEMNAMRPGDVICTRRVGGSVRAWRCHNTTMTESFKERGEHVYLRPYIFKVVIQKQLLLTRVLLQ